MKIMMINGSPKREGSSSGVLLDELKLRLGQEVSEFNVQNRKAEIPQDMKGQDALVLAMPLYVDGVPGHLLEFLSQLGPQLKDQQMVVYAIVNCGFFEGRQNRWALEILENWSIRFGLQWGQGLGIGGGGMMPMLADVPPGKGPKKPVSKALETLAENIKGRSGGVDLFVSPAFPRWLYKLAAEMGWKQQIKANGLRVKDLSARP